VSALFEHWKLSFARVHRSREFEGQPGGHSYGSLSVSYNY
jgi:hypothetical protein